MSAGTSLRRLLSRPEIIIAPGVYDSLSARIAAGAGFSAIYMTGYGTAASLLGQPDVGMLTLSEMVDNARRIVQAVGPQVAVIADADTGYGNPINVTRTVREYEQAGVAAIHIEDQMWPKRCGHMEGKQVIPVQDMVQKVRAAIAARRDPDFVIIARTDARAVNGIDDAIARGRAYADAGADVVFVEGPDSETEIRQVASELKGISLLFNHTASGRSPVLPVTALSEMGYKIAIFPTHTLYAACRAVIETIELLKQGDMASIASRMVSFDQFHDIVGLDEIRRLEREYATSG